MTRFLFAARILFSLTSLQTNALPSSQAKAKLVKVGEDMVVKLRFPIQSKEETTAETAKIAPHFELGRRGEQLAIEHLTQQGYRIVAANFVVPIGRNRR